jgi:cytochrome c
MLFASSQVSVVNKSILAAFVTLMLVSKITYANEQQFGTAEEARAMLDRAVSALKSDEDKALGEFNDPDNKQFHDRDLYVVCFNMSDGKITAYLGPALLGVDIRTLRLNDDPIGQRTYDAIYEVPQGTIATVDYSFPKPAKTERVPKQFIEMRVGDEACGVAYFK